MTSRDVRLRVVLAGDIRLYRDGVALHLARDGRFVVAGVAGDRAELVRRVREELPEIVVLDVAMAGSMDAVRELARESPETRVVALTVPELEQAVIACAEAGIAGYVLRDGSLDDLVRAVESAARGELIVSPRLAGSLLRRVRALAADRAEPPAMEALTAREREIVALIDQGLSNKQIGGRLNIELATVKNHVHRILEKLHVHRRGEIAARVGRGVRPGAQAEGWSARAPDLRADGIPQ